MTLTPPTTTRLTCSTCAFADPTTHLGPDPTDVTMSLVCRRWPPQTMGDSGEAGWPDVTGDDWCGEHRETGIAERVVVELDGVPLTATAVLVLDQARRR